MEKKIVIFGAHEDDMETGMGGTAALLVKEAGYEVVLVVTTPPQEEKKYLGFDGISNTDVRKTEAKEAAKILGVEVKFLSCGIEGNMPVAPKERAMFKQLMNELKPDIVFTQWGIDVNPDHRALSALSIEHCLQKGVNTELFCYEVFSEPGRPQSLGFYPTHYVDIASVMDLKELAVRCHKSQNPNLWKANLEMQALRGGEMNPASGGAWIENAEGFIRITRYGDLDEKLATILRPTLFTLPSGTGVKVDPVKIGLG